MKALVIDDEPLARKHLVKMLGAYRVEVAAEGESGIDALRLTEEHDPEVVFLDIEMPDLSGMQVLAALRATASKPAVVFVTGYSQHAAEAFEHAAFDYLLKPVAPERLALTISRLTHTQGERTAEAPALGPAARIPIRTDYAIKLVRVEEVLCAVAKDKKVTIHTKAGDYRTYYSLTQLEGMLPANDFMRIHAAALVQLSAIDELHFLGNHSYSVRLTDGVTLPVGRTQFGPLQTRLGLAKT